MLKDITLGQFFPGDTFIHRLDPRTKILAVVLYIVALFNAKWLVSYGVVAAVLLACILVSKVHFSALTRGLKPVFVIVIFTAVMNLFFTGGTPGVRRVAPAPHHVGGHLVGGLHGRADRDAHHGDVPADVYDEPHLPHGRAGEPARLFEEDSRADP